jgi:hypothetical protein
MSSHSPFSAGELPLPLLLPCVDASCDSRSLSRDRYWASFPEACRKRGQRDVCVCVCVCV